MSKVKDLTGQTFGRLKVLERAGSNKDGRALWLCKCDCGNIVSIRRDHLTGRQKENGRIGYTISCGCSQESAGELYIKAMLNQIGVKFEAQYKIPELSSFMKFDFAVFDKNNNLVVLKYNHTSKHIEFVSNAGTLGEFYFDGIKIPLITYV